MKTNEFKKHIKNLTVFWKVSVKSNKLKNTQLANAVFSNLLNAHPELTKVFSTYSIPHQSSIVINMLTKIINELQDLNHLANYLIALGKTHIRFLRYNTIEEKKIKLTWMKKAIILSIKQTYPKDNIDEKSLSTILNLVIELMLVGLSAENRDKNVEKKNNAYDNNQTNRIICIDDILKKPITKCRFNAFLIINQGEENLLFLDAVIKINKFDQDKANYIKENFIIDNSENQININHRLKQNIVKNIENNNLENIFDDAIKEVKKILFTNYYYQFMKTL